MKNLEIILFNQHTFLFGTHFNTVIFQFQTLNTDFQGLNTLLEHSSGSLLRELHFKCVLYSKFLQNIVNQSKCCPHVDGIIWIFEQSWCSTYFGVVFMYEYIVMILCSMHYLHDSCMIFVYVNYHWIWNASLLASRFTLAKIMNVKKICFI